MRVHVMVLLLSAVVVTACADPAGVSAGASDDAAGAVSASEATEASTDTAADGTGSTVAIRSGDLGSILVDGEGRTLYLLTTDEQGAPTCYDDCAENWPPLTSPVEPGEGADASLLGDVERDDGTRQATYNDWPLYYFAGDTQDGDVNGQGVGDVWFVLDASGEPVKGGGDEAQTDY